MGWARSANGGRIRSISMSERSSARGIATRTLGLQGPVTAAVSLTRMWLQVGRIEVNIFVVLSIIVVGCFRVAVAKQSLRGWLRKGVGVIGRLRWFVEGGASRSIPRVLARR